MRPNPFVSPLLGGIPRIFRELLGCFGIWITSINAGDRCPFQLWIRTLNDQATILAIGDVHLGTSCSGVPEVVSSMTSILET